MAHYQTIPLWKKAPFTRLLAPLVIGILFQRYAEIPLKWIILFVSISLSALLFFHFQKLYNRFSHSVFQGGSVMLLIAGLGMLSTYLQDIRHSIKWYGHSLQTSTVWKVRVAGTPEEKPKSYKVTANLISAIRAQEELPADGKIVLYFSKDPSVSAIQKEDVLLIANRLVEIKNMPGTRFDYKSYMANQSVFHQAYLRPEEWRYVGKNPKSPADALQEKSLAYINRTENNYLNGNQVIALAKALTTGNRSELHRDLVQAYSNAGVVHIMAISGLHLGLIYVFLLRAIRLIPWLSKNSYFKAILILAGIWFFAFMTGGSPSVLRAAVMFSFLHIGTLMNKKVATYNFWAASAFLLLFFNPLLLWNVGFQLSYMAVLGILVVQKPIYHWVRFQNKILDYCWQLFSVSLAAQLFTLPFCIYYFNQFPLLFLLSNLVAIPLSSIGLWLCILMIITGWMPWIPGLLGKAASFVFNWLNEFITYVDSLTFALWKNIQFNLLETYLFSAVLLLLLFWLMKKNVFALKLALGFVAILITVFQFSGSKQKYPDTTFHQSTAPSIHDSLSIQLQSVAEE